MKTLLTFTLILTTFTAFAQSSSCRSIRIIKANDIRLLDVKLLDGEITITETRGTNIIIEKNITINVQTPNLIEVIHKGGRWDMKIEELDGSTIKVKSTENKGVIVVKGKEVIESFHYKIQVPSHVDVYQNP